MRIPFFGKSKTTLEAERLEREAKKDTAEICQRIEGGEGTEEDHETMALIHAHAKGSHGVPIEQESKNGSEPKPDTTKIMKAVDKGGAA